MPDRVEDLEARLAALPDDGDHARERIDLLNELGWELRERSDWERVLSLAEQTMTLAQRHAYQQGLNGAFRNSAFAHYMLADYKVALAEALVALRMGEELEDTRSQAEALAVLAMVHWTIGSYDQALEEGFRGLRLAEALADIWMTAWGLTILGGIYQSIGDNRKALEFHEKSHNLFAGEHYTMGEARSLSGLGIVYQALGDAEAALECHQKALELYRQINNAVGEARALNDIGVLYQQQGDYPRALDLHHEALRLRQANNNQQAETTSLLNLGRIHLNLDNLGEARKALERALAIAVKIGAKPKESQAHELLAKLSEESGDHQVALEHHRRFHELREEVFSEEETTKLKNLQIGLEVERSERESEIHRLKNVELREKNEQLSHLLHELQATQAQLVHSEKMAALGALVAAIAHEMNTPLGAIRTAADISVKAAERMVEAIEQSATVEELKSRRSVQATVSALRKNGYLIATASDRISHMIGSLKSFARLDQAAFQRFCLNDAVRDSLAVLEPVMPRRIGVVREFGELPHIYGYPAEMNQVVMNLLQNASQAIAEEGTITVKTFGEDGVQCLEISDTGRGIPAEQLDRLFNPGFTIEGARIKASMSLFTSLNIVQRHRGEITVASELGRGTTFTVRLRGLDAAEEAARGAAL